MNKIKVSRLLKTVDFEYYSVVDVIKDLTEILKTHPDAKFGIHSYPYDDHDYLGIFYEEEETDKEYSKRIEKETKFREQQEARERTEFERLSKKFG